jgi:hypothetical protein
MSNLTLDQSRFQALVKAGVRKFDTQVSEELHAVKPMREKLFSSIDSDRAYEDFNSIGGVGDIPRFNGVLTFGDIPMGYSTRIEPGESALGLEMERKLWENNLYPVLKDMAGELRKSLHRTKEKSAIKSYANIASTAFDFMTSEEGVALASTAHTTKASGVSTSSGFSNLGSSALSPTSVEATRILMGGFKNINGEYMSVEGNGFLGPTTLEQRFAEICQTPKGLDSAQGNINTQASRNWKWETSQYFNDYSTKSWGMVNWELLRKLAIWIDKVDADLTTTVDFNTFKIKHSIYSYWGQGFKGWPFIYWHQVS